MRLSAATILCLLLLSAAASAAKAPTVDELIKRAIAALENTSYKGRLRYVDSFEDSNSTEKLVEITFLSPSSFRVQPYISEKQKAGYFFIENSDRMVKIYSDGKTVEEMPSRQFIINTMLRRRLLETLAGKPSINLLEGVYNGEPVWILRDEGRGEYSFTIHISERNDYPISMEFIDENGRRVHYFEFEELEFLTASEIPKGTFAIPVSEMPRQRAGSAAPPMADVEMPENDAQEEATAEQELKYMPRTARLSAGNIGDSPGDDEAYAAFMQSIPFPLLPDWVPLGYRLNTIAPLDYSSDGEPMLVYHLELYNPESENMISIFETRSEELEELFKAGDSVASEGYFVARNDDGWIVAVFGSITRSQFEQIMDGLRRSDEEAMEMISRELSREELRRWAEDVCTPETHPDPS